jgi:hypothetical protein
VVSGPPAATLPDSVAELRRRRGRSHAGGPGRWEGPRWVQGDSVNTTAGTTLAQEHRRVAVLGKVAQRRRSLTPASNCAHKGVGNGKSWAYGGWLPRERAPGHLNGGGDTVRPWVDGGGASAARWRFGLRE